VFWRFFLDFSGFLCFWNNICKEADIMGNPKDYESCPFGDNSCWPSGKTPKVLIVTISGVTMTSPYEEYNPNGVYYCEQVSDVAWESKEPKVCSVSIVDAEVIVGCNDENHVMQFYGVGGGPCEMTIEGQPCGDNWKYGKAVISWCGPDETPGSDIETGEEFGILDPPSAQFEHNATDDIKPSTRIAQKKNHTCVYLKGV